MTTPAAPKTAACPGPLVWFTVPKRGEHVEWAGILECSACGYVIVSGNFNDEAHAETPFIREGLAA